MFFNVHFERKKYLVTSETMHRQSFFGIYNDSTSFSTMNWNPQCFPSLQLHQNLNIISWRLSNCWLNVTHAHPNINSWRSTVSPHFLYALSQPVTSPPISPPRSGPSVFSSSAVSRFLCWWENKVHLQNNYLHIHFWKIRENTKSFLSPVRFSFLFSFDRNRE